MNNISIIKQTDIYTIDSLVKGALYSIAKVTQKHFDDGFISNSILSLSDYVIYVGKDFNTYYFKPVLYEKDTVLRVHPYITGSPDNIDINEDDIISVDRSLLVGADFKHKGVNELYDYYSFDRCVDDTFTKSSDKPATNVRNYYSEYKVICTYRDGYKPLKGVFSSTKYFDKNVIKQYKILNIFNMNTCKLDTYNIVDIKVDKEFLRSDTKTILTIDDMKTVTISDDSKDTIVVVIGGARNE